MHSAAKKIQSRSKKSLLVSPKGRESNIHESGKIQTWWWWAETYRCWARRSLSWIQQRRSNMLRVSRKFIMFKAKSIYDEKCGDNEELKVGFVASNGWLTKYMKRNNLSMRRWTTIAEKVWPFPPYGCYFNYSFIYCWPVKNTNEQKLQTTNIAFIRNVRLI